MNISTGMRTFTLDTNCIIALENKEPTAGAIQALVEAHDRGNANVAVVAISASEKQRNQQQLETFTEFQLRLSTLGLGKSEVLPSIFYWDITFWDWCYWSDEAKEVVERRIHEILFPDVPFLWPDFINANHLDPAALPLNSKWRNAKCDVLAIWSHIHHARDVFVTNDHNFHKLTKKSALTALGAGRIEQADAAMKLLVPLHRGFDRLCDECRQFFWLDQQLDASSGSRRSPD